MSNPGIPSLDQLKVFLTVVETGSFAAAARRLSRATSAISYTIATLETQLGVPLFDRESTRKPTLTEAGMAVLSEARTVCNGVDSLRARVRGLISGLEGEVVLAVDVMLPTERLVDALHAFEAEFPTVAIKLHVEALGAVVHLVQEGRAGIGISGPLQEASPGIESIHIGHVELIPVASPLHALVSNGNPTPGDIRKHVQLVLTDRSPVTEGHDFGVLSLRTWRLADLGSKHALLVAGIGWGNMPEPMVRADIEAGRLVRLRLPESDGGRYKLSAIHRIDAPPGPAASWLIQRFAAQTQARV
ncbi:LysR family transcriptional regulator [Paraburkholderia heleia]|uniref:LysR family transcriptional regulator n=1 Tax=Paraburkholderia heleia TaxID=634127 RepID=UPI0031E037C0